MSAESSAATAFPRRAAVASFFGSMVEFFDFFAYGSASALVFSHVFFSNLPVPLGTVVSLATFAIAYVARPFGSLVVGHLGDRLGRKRILMYTLLTMGTATFLVGCLPGYSTAGWWAPVLLLVLRIVQGLSASGEQSGASSLTLEHSPEGKRGFYTSFTLVGTVAGLIVANLVFLPVAGLPDDQLYSWGWRIPFWASAVMVVIALFVRRALPEPAEFEKAKQRNEIVRFPLVVFIKHYWREFFIILFSLLFSVVFTLFNVFSLSYAPQNWHLSSSGMLWIMVIANLLQMITIPIWARISDRVGRKPVFIIGSLGLAVTIFLYFAAMTTSNWLLVLLAGILLMSVFYSAVNSIYFCFYNEMFDVRVRFTGVAVSTQFASLLQGFIPAISSALVKPGPTGWIPDAVLLSALCLVGAIAAAFARETARTPLAQLGSENRIATEALQIAN